MVEGAKKFVRFDLAITRAVHAANIMNRVYPVLDRDIDPDLHIEPEDVPNYRDLKQILDRVGKPYGWDRRTEYHLPEQREEIARQIESPSSKRFSFWSGKKEVGGVIVANVEPNIAGIFESASKLPQHKDLTPEVAAGTVEIYKIGLFPEYTKRGWGRYFLADVLRNLFDDASQPQAVYLNTRSTNHAGVISFYTGLNMNVIGASSYPDDLLSTAEIQGLKKLAKRSSDFFERPAPLLEMNGR